VERKIVNIATRFPGDPQHGDIFEFKKGLLYQWDAGINSWIEITSSSVNLPLATPISKGAMSSADLRKLNRLVLPPPQSTLIGTDCVAPFQRGIIGLLPGDEYVGVNGNLDIRNIDEFGDTINESHAFHIHQNTYGFDFTLDLPRLIQTLIAKNQILLTGQTGDKGQKGDTGDPGITEIISGPQGEKGEQGLAPECTLTINPEPISAEKRPGLKRALARARIVDHATDKTKFILEFDRQVVGTANASTSQFNTKNSSSFWVLAVASIAGTSQPVYYIDIEPIIEAVRQKYLSEVDRLKQGYEDIVEFWIQTMSDLFDEQKAALCCALEYCMSVRKSINQRQHMESVAASAIGAHGAQIRLHDRSESVEIGSTRTLKRMPRGSDLCDNNVPFPQKPSQFAAEAAGLQNVSQEIIVDPQLNIATTKTAVVTELPKGRYAATIKTMNARVGGKYGVTIKIQHTYGGSKRAAQFLNKGRFESLADAKNAYEGLSLAFNHDGGNIYVYFPVLPNPDSSGNAVVIIESIGIQTPEPQQSIEHALPKVEVVEAEQGIAQFTCSMDASHLRWYENGWKANKCCGLVTNIGGQDYIIFKRSIGDDIACGGGESDNTPCIAASKEILGQSPAFAWPTFDKKNFAPIWDGSIIFRYDEAMNHAVQQSIDHSNYENPKGSPAGYRHLAYQLSVVLFPAS
jgi:hypothetical protein